MDILKLFTAVGSVILAVILPVTAMVLWLMRFKIDSRRKNTKTKNA